MVYDLVNPVNFRDKVEVKKFEKYSELQIVDEKLIKRYFYSKASPKIG